MKYTNISLNNETEENKNLFRLLLLASIFVSFFAMAILYFVLPNKLKNETKELSLAFVNIQLILFLLSFTGFLAPIAFIINLIIVLAALNQLTNNEPVKVPVLFEILKVPSQNSENVSSTKSPSFFLIKP